MAARKNQMSVEELQEKVVQLEKYKLAEEKEKKKEEALRAKQGKVVRKALVVEKQKTKTAERKRERELEALTKTVTKLADAEYQSAQKIIEFDQKVAARVENTRQGHMEKYQALQEKMFEAGGAKGKLSHLQFAVKSLESNLVLPIEFSKSKNEVDDPNWSNHELTVALQEEVEQLQEETGTLEDENRRLREELEDVRRVIEAPEDLEESEEEEEEPSEEESLGDDADDTSASAAGPGGASMPTVSPRTAPSTQAMGSPIPREDPEGGYAASSLASAQPMLARHIRPGSPAAVAAGVGYSSRSSWPPGVERVASGVVSGQPSRMSTPASMRGGQAEISPFMAPRIFPPGPLTCMPAGMPGAPARLQPAPGSLVPTEPLADGKPVVQHVTVDALRQFQRLQGDGVPGMM